MQVWNPVLRFRVANQTSVLELTRNQYDLKYGWGASPP